MFFEFMTKIKNIAYITTSKPKSSCKNQQKKLRTQINMPTLQPSNHVETSLVGNGSESQHSPSKGKIIVDSKDGSRVPNLKAKILLVCNQSSH
jgi:hypothetical protein